MTTGENMHRLIGELYPICRSITGEGLRATLQRLQKEIPVDLHEVPTGTVVFDWTVPKEWNIRDAYIKDEDGHRVVDFRDSNLHVVNYSRPIHTKMSLDELRPHLFTIPDRPDWIPYRTSYYEETWGFCLSKRVLNSLPEGHYEVCIDSTLEDGSLTYGEYFIQGATDEEVLLSCHVCHPSLCNDNLSGIAVAVSLAQWMAEQPRRLSYRFLFLPGAIGPIAWLSRNQGRVQRIRHGLVLTCVGDPGGFHYKRSRQGDATIDRAVAYALRHSGRNHEVTSFSPYGYAERQYCSPGFNLPVGCLMRSEWGRFPEYHTSADNLDFVRPEALGESLELCAAVMRIIDENQVYVNQKPYCEPQLDRRELFSSNEGQGVNVDTMAVLWVLNLADGSHTLLDIAERSGLPFSKLLDAVNVLLNTDLLRQS